MLSNEIALWESKGCGMNPALWSNHKMHSGFQGWCHLKLSHMFMSSEQWTSVSLQIQSRSLYSYDSYFQVIMYSWTHHEYYIPFLPINQKTQYKLDSKLYVSEVKTSGIYIILSYNNTTKSKMFSKVTRVECRPVMAWMWMLCTL